MTPLTKLASLPAVQSLLREGVTLADLLVQARVLTDLQAAKKLNAARLVLFRPVTTRSTAPPAARAARAA